jgi:hypothetical protein
MGRSQEELCLSLGFFTQDWKLLTVRTGFFLGRSPGLWPGFTATPGQVSAYSRLKKDDT